MSAKSRVRRLVDTFCEAETAKRRIIKVHGRPIRGFDGDGGWFLLLLSLSDLEELAISSCSSATEL